MEREELEGVEMESIETERVEIEDAEMGKDEEVKEEALTPEEKRKNVLKEMFNTVAYVLAVIIICFVVVNYVGQRTIVVGDSMQNTLFDGDNLIVDKLSYRFKSPERFDIVVFPCKSKENTLYIKRIIGLPGESVRIDIEGNIYINGQILEEDYGKEIIEYAGLAENEIYLGADEYFVLGDNRNASEDSRFPNVGVVDAEDLVGRAIWRLYPFNDFGKLD